MIDTRRVSAILALLPLLLAACADEGPQAAEVSASPTAPAATPRQHFASDLEWRRPACAGEASLLALAALLERPTVKVRAEPLGPENWGPFPDPLERAGLRLWLALPRFPILGAGGGLRAAVDAMLEHERRVLHRIADPGRLLDPTATISGDSYGASAHGLCLVLPASVEPPLEGYRASYLTRSASVREYLGLDTGDPPGRQGIQLGKEVRPARLLRRELELAREVTVPPGAELRFGYGYRQLKAVVDGDALRLVPAHSSDDRLILDLLAADGSSHMLFQRELRNAASEQYHDVAVDLEAWSNERIRLRWRLLPSDPDRADAGAVPPCFLAGPTLEGRPAHPAPRPGVVLVLVDTLRADGLGCYGNPRPLSPAIDALARAGVRFLEARPSSSWTLPAHASLFSSLLARQHDAAETSSRLAPSFTTLAEVLSAGGYATAAFTGGGFVGPRFGLEQGFERYDASGGGAAAVCERALEWIGAQRGPFFAFVHTFEVHAPYDPPEPFRSRFVRPYRGALPDTVTELELRRRAANPEAAPLTPQDRLYVRDLYEAGIAYTDHVLGTFFQDLGELGIRDDTLLIFTSDHGEEFAEHGGFGHGVTLYEEQLRVPLILHRPGSFTGGRTISHPVRLEDIAPTILEQADLPVPPEWIGVALTDTTTPREMIATLGAAAPGHRLLATFHGGHKWIASGRSERPAELYDLAADPGEQRDLAGTAPTAPWEARVRRLLERFPPAAAGSTSLLDLTPEELRELRALGYLGDDERR